MKKNNKVEFSKYLAIFSILLVFFTFLDFFIINDKIIEGELMDYDFTGFSVAIPSVCTLCTATIIFYYNKSKLENAIKIKYEYIKNLLQLKKKMNLYQDTELQSQIDEYIAGGEYSAQNDLENSENKASEEIEGGNL